MSKKSPEGNLKPLSDLEKNINAYNKFIDKADKLLGTSLETLLELKSFGVALDVSCQLYYLRDLHNNIRIPFIVIDIYKIKIAFISNYFTKPKISSRQSKEFEKSCLALKDAGNWIKQQGDNHEQLQRFFKTLS